MSAGRQRSFDKEEALAKAVEVFWRNGYSGTSLSDLTKAMDINKPSLYAAFGNKEKLFVSALNQYVQEYGSPHFEQLCRSNLDLKQRLQVYLEAIVAMASDKNLPGGCFVVASICEAKSSCLPPTITQVVSGINEASLSAISDFFQAEQAKGNLADTKSPEQLADLFMTLQVGLSIMAKSGVEPARLKQVIMNTVSFFF